MFAFVARPSGLTRNISFSSVYCLKRVFFRRLPCQVVPQLRAAQLLGQRDLQHGVLRRGLRPLASEGPLRGSGPLVSEGPLRASGLRRPSSGSGLPEFLRSGLKGFVMCEILRYGQ